MDLNLPKDCPLKLTDKFRYLGLEVQLPISKFLDNQSLLYWPLKQKIKIVHCTKYPLNLLGRVNFFFQYIFTEILIHSSQFISLKHVFQDLDSLILTFTVFGILTNLGLHLQKSIICYHRVGWHSPIYICIILQHNFAKYCCYSCKSIIGFHKRGSCQSGLWTEHLPWWGSFVNGGSLTD